jgi:hypothetical protein
MVCTGFRFDSSMGSARYYEEVPVDYVHESDFGEAATYFVVTLE